MFAHLLKSRSTRLTIIPLSLVCLLMMACNLTSIVAKQPRQETPPTATPQPVPQDFPTIQPTLPANSPTDQANQSPTQGSSSNATVDPCKLVTSAEVTDLLGSSPAPDARTNMPGDFACDFMVDTGLLSVDAATNPQASAEFYFATSHLSQNPGYKSLQSQGISIVVYGGDNVDGNNTPGFTAFMNKGNSMVIIKFYSKTYAYNADKAVALLKTIGSRLP